MLIFLNTRTVSTDHYALPKTKRDRLQGFHGLNSPAVPSDLLKNGPYEETTVHEQESAMPV
jgi:hypothetical protein